MSSDEDDIEILKGIKKGALDISGDDLMQIGNDKDLNQELKEEQDELAEKITLSGAECLKRCKEFASVTGTDSALAMFYLQDTNWDLEKGLNAYFQNTQESNSKIVACFDIDKLNDDERKAFKRKGESESTSKKMKTKLSEDDVIEIDEDEYDAYEYVMPKSNGVKDAYDADEDTDLDKSIKAEEKSLDSSKEISFDEIEFKKHFKLLSWNIDGLDSTSLENRTIGVATTILKEEPDVVFLQEVVRESEKLLYSKLKPNYEFTTGNADNFKNNNRNLFELNLVDRSKEYYTMILTKRKTCTVVKRELVDFPNTKMTRNLLKVKFLYKKMVNVCVMTSHLESTADFARERMDQLKLCFKHVQEQDDNYVVFFGGDLNLRDSELEAIGGPPKGVCDVWQATGSRKECLYTWDCSRNTNLRMNSKFKPKCRFDRLYYRAVRKDKDLKAVTNLAYEMDDFTLMPIYFELEGLNRLKTCSRFCSDHWAIQTYCQIEQA